MNTYLTNNSQLRTETDESVISNLLRKGWIEIFAPSYDPQTQQIEFDSQTGQFIVVEIPEDQIKQNTLSQAVSQGFLVQPENFILGLQESDRNAFAQMLALVKEALDLNLIDNDTIQTIGDIDGVKHSVTTLRFRQIMVEYGFYYKNLWDQYSL